MPKLNTSHCRSGKHLWNEENIGLGNNGNFCKICQRENNRKNAILNKEIFYNRKRAFKLKKFYNITIEDYDRMLEKQNNCCKICNIHISEIKNKLVVDHNHKTNKVRGLLCNTCNRAIGLLKDNIEILNNAIKYLKEDEYTN